jgi:coenzyme F420-reducing hydrogenase delta subunit/NAD-dependent dihydropyrimidine dehydrogenase PreA subunit
MIYGLLTGKLMPTEYIAGKVFSCFYCKRCEAACSSGVPLTDIFTDAKKDLAAAGFRGPGTTSVTDKNCALCLACIETCPHDARRYANNKIIVNPAACQGCGICVETCPAGAIRIENTYGTSRAELSDGIKEFFKENDKAEAIVFACNWSYYPDLQASRLEDHEMHEKNYKILVNMCGGRLDLPLLLEPFLNRAKGIMVACCPEEECPHEGNGKAALLARSMKSLLESMDMDPERIKLVEIAPGDKSGFQAEIDQFMEELSARQPI